MGQPSRRRNGRGRPRGAAVALSLIIHLVLLTGLGLGVRRALDYPAAPIVLVRLIPTPAAPLTHRPTNKTPARAASRTPAERPVPAKPLATAAPEPPAITAPPAAPSPSQADTADLTEALRGAVGCAHADLMRLSPAERERCARRLAAIRDSSSEFAEAPIDPAKRNAYDAVHDPANTANLKTIVGCKATFGVGGFKWVRPAKGLKLGPLLCYIAPAQIPAP